MGEEIALAGLVFGVPLEDVELYFSFWNIKSGSEGDGAKGASLECIIPAARPVLALALALDEDGAVAGDSCGQALCSREAAAKRIGW